MIPKTIYITAHVKFEEPAKRSFNFPISNAIRLSFWLPGASGSTFSELSCSTHIEMGIQYTVNVKLAENEILIGKVKEGVEFFLGVYPIVIANGKVITVN